MKFGEFPVYDALGIELVHDVKCREKTLKKGLVLTSSDISLLKYSGVKTVTGVQFSSQDIQPETAADILLKTLVGDYLRYTVPDKNGYSEIFADTDGTLVFDQNRLNRFNAHNETISLMTIPPYTSIYKGQFVANLRLFGPAVTAETLNEAVTKISGTGSLLKAAPYAFCKIGFIRTLMNNSSIPPLDEDKLMARFAAFGFNVVYSDLCEHSAAAVEKAVRDSIDAQAEIVLIESQVPPLHRDDIVPTGFKEAAGDIDRLGWPVDTGLSLVIGHKKDVRLLGYCADDINHPDLDRLLRLLATKSLPAIEDLPLLALNGISLGRMAKRITPEQMKNSVQVEALSGSKKIAIVILAAGSSRRMIGTNKLLESVNGLPIIDHTVRSALSSQADYVAVVTGHEAKFIERRLEQYDVKIVRNPDYVSGVLGSIRLGLAVLPADIAGAVVLPADMPAFTEEYIDKLIDAFDFTAKRRPVVLPTFNSVRHNPVLWPRDLFNVVKIVPEDSQWVPTLIEHSDYIKEIPLKDDLPLTDINTRGDLAKYLERKNLISNAEQDLFALEKRR
ncbi:MAG: NTP transferase domain-containing protein [Alphaproteobacteria bacterium]|nr:NTP transferase domain-containing protein [Alphaproteobacteria bacterium]